ncbi:hypothetical protein KZZ07_21685 [Mameliella sp. CS4]|uniref:hypothetical protein n=1 Tax=Mameliella sp. CS4 TaxID=2862329 RepID=UPI001C5F525A|nr:hypothetical protein [Mameliella sp. CS4]MBW4985159.1 hypothetical protein [Mameliella sp. CS4]
MPRRRHDRYTGDLSATLDEVSIDPDKGRRHAIFLSEPERDVTHVLLEAEFVRIDTETTLARDL